MSNDPDSTVYPASCLCGGVRYDVSGPLDEAALCHCSMCRRATGSAFNVAVPVAEAQLRWIARGTLREFESSPGKMRAFCSGCGAAVYSRRTAKPGQLRLRIGLIEGLSDLSDVYHIYWADRLSWMDRFGDLPKNAGEEPGRS
ncbi:GFA family protein [Novosphingopyxis iocasae]|uniref:GFA family protein n=1 Tax=Novosphingopyxis iocasae TaxID=2762729 RepID=UPI0016510391|nr:GFA family protein [Novosphingopyxis iocasae]